MHAPEIMHTRFVGLRAVGDKGWQVVTREVFPDGRVEEKEATPILTGTVQMTSRLQRTIALVFFHARQARTWIRGTVRR